MALTSYDHSKKRGLTQNARPVPRHSDPFGGHNNQIAPMRNSGASPIDGMMQRMEKHHEMASNMMSQMMKGFGGDPFANDPFFSQPFGRVDDIIGQMRNDMKRAMAEPMSMGGGSGKGLGRFTQMQSMTSMKTDSNGRPVQETYSTKAQGAFGNGNKVTERHQMYQNSGNGHQKMAHERMMNGQGRKVVRQRVGGAGGPSESRDLFRGVDPSQANAFDREWEEIADRMGFNYGQNRLGYGSNMPSHGGNRASYQQPSSHGSQALGIDNARRGHYIPTDARALDAPVQMRGNGGARNNIRDIEPTAPGASIHAPGAGRNNLRGGNAAAAAPLALPSGNDNAAPRRQAAAPQHQAARVHRVPGRTQAKPAKAG